MTDLIVNSDDAARASPTASSADSQPQGVQARPPYGLASAALPFLGSSDDGPAALQPCPARRALGLAGASWAEELRVRAEHMLLGNGERPRASGMAAVAPQAINALVLDLRDAVSASWKARADGIKASCAPNVPTGLVDEMDVLGWLTADALGRPLLHPDDTNAVGKRVATQAGRVEGKLQGVEARTCGSLLRRSSAAARARARAQTCSLPPGSVWRRRLRWLQRICAPLSS